MTGYRQRLQDEIVDTFDPDTFLSSTANRSEASRRSGVEAEANWSLNDAPAAFGELRLSQRQRARRPRIARCAKLRRPKHSGSDRARWQAGRLTYGALGRLHRRALRHELRRPSRSRRVKLGAYWLAGARVAYDVADGVQLFARAANAFDARYQDVLGYRTEGRSVYAGIRLAARRLASRR